MLSPTTFISPSTNVLEPKIVSSSSSSSAFLDDDVSSTSLDMRNCDVAESGLTQNRAIVKPMQACPNSRGALSHLSSNPNDELGLRSSYSQITRTRFGQPIDGPPMLARNTRGRERPGFSGSMKAVSVSETALNDERLVALARRMLCLNFSGDVVLIDKTDSMAYYKQTLDPSICGVILRKNCGTTSIKILETGEVLKVGPFNRLGGSDGDGNIVLVVKKANKTACIYGTPAVRFLRRVTLQRDFELFEDSAMNWEAIEEAAKVDYEFENFAREEAEARERGRRSDAERKRREKECEIDAGQPEREAH